MRLTRILLTLLISMIICITACVDNTKYRKIPVAEYVNKMKAAWIGQMIGVGWGASTEFQFVAKTIPEDKVPEFNSDMVNVFGQNDLYVEMTFLRTLEQYGIDCTIEKAGIDFANSE